MSKYYWQGVALMLVLCIVWSLFSAWAFDNPLRIWANVIVGGLLGWFVPTEFEKIRLENDLRREREREDY